MPTAATLDEIVRLARSLTPLEKLHLIEQIAPELEATLQPETGMPASNAFDRFMAEAETDTVAVGHVDDSREAMHSRTEHE